MQLWHRTSPQQAFGIIVRHGFGEGAATIRLSDEPPDPKYTEPLIYEDREYVIGVTIDAPTGVLDEFEKTAEGDPYRQWEIPAQTLKLLAARVKGLRGAQPPIPPGRPQPNILFHRTTLANAEMILLLSGFRLDSGHDGVWLSDIPLFKITEHVPVEERTADGEHGSALLEVIIDGADGFLAQYEWVKETTFREWLVPPEILNARIRKIRMMPRREALSLYPMEILKEGAPGQLSPIEMPRPAITQERDGIPDLREDLHQGARDAFKGLGLILSMSKSRKRDTRL